MRVWTRQHCLLRISAWAGGIVVIAAAAAVAGPATAAGGASPDAHWAFRPPRRPQSPPVRFAGWPRQRLDAFVLARLEAEGLVPADEAEPATLFRRDTLDLTGLPPAPDEVDTFLDDDAPDAFERTVDRLLASPRFGERVASRWLDAGWRDWVIDAFNRNLPYDQFTIEQIAGDLLPGATLEQRIATGFNRNHRQNSEGGIIAEEYAVEYVADRVDTTATVWLGLTAGCARCHDHKFDPVSQRDFYQLFAFFNNVPEHGRAIKVGNSPPVTSSATARDVERPAALDAELARAEAECRRLEPELARAQSAWESAIAGSAVDGSHSRGFAVELRPTGKSSLANSLRAGARPCGGAAFTPSGSGRRRPRR